MQLSSKKGRAAPGNSLSAFPRALVGHAAACGAERVRKNLLRRFLGYYRPHLPMLAADLGCAVLVSATALALPLCANYITRQVTAFGANAAVLGQIYLIGAAMLGLLVLQVSSTFFVDYQGHMMGARIENQVRRELFEHCQKLSFSFYDRNRVGQLMSRITNDSLWLGEVFHHAPEDLTIMALKFGGVVAILMHIDPWMTGLILLPTPLALAYALYFARRMEAALARAKREIAAVNERIEDSLAGIRVVQSFANERLESRLFHAANSHFLQSRRHGYLSEAWFSAGTSSFAELVTIGVIALGALRVAEARLSVADLLTFLLCVAVLVDPINRITTAVRWWQDGFTGFARAMEILDTAPEIRDRPGARELPRPRGAIAFENVTFESDHEPYNPGAALWKILPRNETAKERIDALLANWQDVPSRFQTQMARFHDHLEGKGPLPVTSADSRRALEIVTAFYHSSETRTEVTMPIGPEHPKYRSWLPASHQGTS